MTVKLPLRYRWERMAGEYAAMKRWQGYDGPRMIGFIQYAPVGGYEWHQIWDNEAFGPSLPASGGIAENANRACVAVERAYDDILDGNRPDLSERVQERARKFAASSWVRAQT